MLRCAAGYLGERLGGLLGLLLCGSALAQPSAELIAALDRYVPELMARDHVPGTVVALVEHGEVVWTQGYGVANKVTGLPMTPQHVMAHGSNSKIVTAWGALKLVEQGRVELDAPVDRYLKRWHLPTGGPDPSGVTLRRLLSHTAGLARDPVTFLHPRRSPPSLERIFSGELLGGLPVRFAQEPGAGYLYSNAGYGIVQLLIEDVTGEPFADYIQREILEPLAMHRSHMGWTPELQAAAPRAYGARGERLPFLRNIETSAGGLVGPVTDYARLVAATMPGPHGEPPGRGVLKPETVALMMVPQPSTGGEQGLGYVVGSLEDGSLVVGHAGNYYGWWANFGAAPERGTGIVVAANSERAQALVSDVLGLWGLSVSGHAPVLESQASPFRVNALQVAWLGLAAVLGAGALGWAWRVQTQVRQGGRRWARRPSLRGALLAGGCGALALGWLLLAYGSMPLGFGLTVIDLLPWESTWVTAALLLWACAGVISAFLPKSEGPDASTQGAQLSAATKSRSRPKPFWITSREVAKLSRR